MSKTLEQAVEDFNKSPGRDRYTARVVDTDDKRIGEDTRQIEVLFALQHTGTFFEDVEEFEQWAYEGGDSA